MSRVLVLVEDGVASVFSDGDVEVLLVDYDVDDIETLDAPHDVEGRDCAVSVGTQLDAVLVDEMFGHFVI
jgi:hypothetical protein